MTSLSVTVLVQVHDYWLHKLLGDLLKTSNCKGDVKLLRDTAMSWGWIAMGLEEVYTALPSLTYPPLAGVF